MAPGRDKQKERKLMEGFGGICSGWRSERPGLTLLSPDLMMRGISKPPGGQASKLPASFLSDVTCHERTEENGQLRSSGLVTSPCTH